MPLIGNIKGATGNTGPAGSAGDPGANGANGATWYTGTVTPANTVGVDNDLFLNTTTGDVLKKVAGSW